MAPASPARSGKRLSALRNSSQLNGVYEPLRLHGVEDPDLSGGEPGIENFRDFALGELGEGLR